MFLLPGVQGVKVCGASPRVAVDELVRARQHVHLLLAPPEFWAGHVLRCVLAWLWCRNASQPHCFALLAAAAALLRRTVRLQLARHFASPHSWQTQWDAESYSCLTCDPMVSDRRISSDTLFIESKKFESLIFLWQEDAHQTMICREVHIQWKTQEGYRQKYFVRTYELASKHRRGPWRNLLQPSYSLDVQVCPCDNEIYRILLLMSKDKAEVCGK